MNKDSSNKFAGLNVKLSQIKPHITEDYWKLGIFDKFDKKIKYSKIDLSLKIHFIQFDRKFQ